jgi:hypothetical protein
MTTVRLTKITQGMLLTLVAGASAFGQEVGDTVRAKQIVDLKVEDKAVASASTGEFLTVRRKNDKWLWVQTVEGQRGWVLTEHVEVVPNPPPAAKPAPAPSKAAGKDDYAPWLRTIGVLSGQNIYTTNAYIGAIADGYVHGAYNAERVQQLMAEVVGMIKSSRSGMESVRATNIVDQDKAALDELIVILDLLSQEAEALSRYVDSKSESELQAYEKARNDVWPKVEKMLKLK